MRELTLALPLDVYPFDLSVVVTALASLTQLVYLRMDGSFKPAYIPLRRNSKAPTSIIGLPSLQCLQVDSVPSIFLEHVFTHFKAPLLNELDVRGL